MERYERVKKIGEGSFGKALLVRRKADCKQFVIKEINIAKMMPKEREEARKEVNVLSLLKHSNIVSYQESFEGKGNLYIVMDYCEAGDLYQKITTQKGVNFSEDQVLDYFVQICLALKHIHDRKILHRDLKSQNIFLTRQGIVKLGDFGIARVLKSTVELARTCIGTPYYLSPEICENRPYNNKSDVWSLGCVLYELCTLKHPFESGNMKNLVLKIVRGTYPPIPNRYTVDMRALVAQCFKRSPLERPSVNTILRKPFIQERIRKFLDPEVMEEEFSHTVIHKKRFNIAKQPPGRPPIADAKRHGPAQVYGAPVGKKPAPIRKPPVPVISQNRPPNAVKRNGAKQQNRVLEDKRKSLEAREKRRKDVISKQEQQYQEYMKKIQQERWEKQQRHRINQAREVGWRNVLSASEEIEEKKKKDTVVKQPGIVAKQPEPMHKYQPKQQENNEEKKKKNEDQDKENKAQIVQAEHKNRPLPPPAQPINAWDAAKGARDNRDKGAKAAEQARVVEDFWQRKREAAANRLRGNVNFAGAVKPRKEIKPEPNIKPANPLQQQERRIIGGVFPRNRGEAAYLDQLEQIRKRNFYERRALQKQQYDAKKPPEPVKEEPQPKPHVKPGKDILPGDPRYDPEARRQKIAALKEQAEHRAAMLREQLMRRRNDMMVKLEKHRNEEPEQKDEGKLRENPGNNRPLQKKNAWNVPKGFAPARVGIDTAMNQLGTVRLFRSCSEGDLSELKKDTDGAHPRKHWGEFAPLQFAALPLEATASAMEATSSDDAVIISKQREAPTQDIATQDILSDQVRRQWGQEGKTQIISMLHKAQISENTTSPLSSANSSSCSDKGTTIVLNKKLPITSERKPAKPGDTFTVSSSLSPSKQMAEKGRPKIGETMTLSRDASSDADEDNSSLTSSDQKSSPFSATVIKRPNRESKETDVKKNVELVGSSSMITCPIESNKKNDLRTDPQRKNTTENPKGGKQEIEESLKQANQGRDSTKTDINAVCDEKGKVFKETEKVSPRPRSSRPLPQAPTESRSAYQEFINSQKKANSLGISENQPLFQRVEDGQAKLGDTKESDDLEVEEFIEEDESFHTPNTSPVKEWTVGLQTGCYDVSTKDLRTCSLPDLRPLFIENNSDNFGSNNLNEDENDIQISENSDNESGLQMSNKVEIQEPLDNETGSEELDEYVEEDLDEVEDENGSDEEGEDFENMLSSMRDVLNRSCHSPVATATKPILEISDEEDDDDDARSSSTSSLSKLNEDWDSDEGDSDVESERHASDPEKDTTMSRAEKKAKEKETLFQRIEESRKSLEDDLGLERFLKVYKYLQAMQENEDDELTVGTGPATEITDLLGPDHEHLYPNVLYLVMADAAYFEDND